MKRIYILCVILLAFSCNTKVKEDNNKNDAPVNYKPLFLSLSPDMSDTQFQSELQKLNKQHKLEKNQFALPINNEYYYFNVNKEKHSIYLFFSSNKGYRKKDLNYKISDEILAGYKNQSLEFKKLFDKLYINSIKEIPNNIDVGDYSIYKMNYSLYKDDDKYILFGYRVNGDRIGNQKENNQRMDGLIYQTSGKHIKKDNVEEKEMSRYLKATSSSPTNADFGFDIKIHYFHQKYIDSLIVEMKIENKEMEKKNLDLQNKNDHINEIRKNNINEL